MCMENFSVKISNNILTIITQTLTQSTCPVRQPVDGHTTNPPLLQSHPPRLPRISSWFPQDSPMISSTFPADAAPLQLQRCSMPRRFALKNLEALQNGKWKMENGKRTTPPTFHWLQCWAVQDVESQKSHHGIKVLHAAMPLKLKMFEPRPKKRDTFFETRRDHKLKNVETTRQFQIFQWCLLKHSQWFCSSKVSDVDVLAQMNQPEPTELFFPHFSPPCHGVLCCWHGAGGCTVCRCGGSRDGRLGEGSSGQGGCCTWPITVPGERKVTSKLKCKENMKKQNSSKVQHLRFATKNLPYKFGESTMQNFGTRKLPWRLWQPKELQEKDSKSTSATSTNSRPRGAQGVGSALKCRGDLPQWV